MSSLKTELTISIAMCTYNGDKFLKQQLESFLTQTLLPDELIISDDNSNDRTLEILDLYRDKAPFKVKIFQSKRTLGVAKNFEKALGLCSGDLIFLADQDDRWLPKKIENFKRFFEKNMVQVAFSNGFLIDDSGVRFPFTLWDVFDFNSYFKFRIKWGRLLPIFLLQNKNRVTGATLAFRKEILNTIIPIPKIDYFLHDAWITMVASLHDSLGYINENLIEYRLHENQQIGTFERKLADNKTSFFVSFIRELKTRSTKINSLIIDKCSEHYLLRTNPNVTTLKSCIAFYHQNNNSFHNIFFSFSKGDYIRYARYPLLEFIFDIYKTLKSS